METSKAWKKINYRCSLLFCMFYDNNNIISFPCCRLYQIGVMAGRCVDWIMTAIINNIMFLSILTQLECYSTYWVNRLNACITCRRGKSFTMLCLTQFSKGWTQNWMFLFSREKFKIVIVFFNQITKKKVQNSPRFLFSPDKPSPQQNGSTYNGFIDCSLNTALLCIKNSWNFLAHQLMQNRLCTHFSIMQGENWKENP